MGRGYYCGVFLLKDKRQQAAKLQEISRFPARISNSFARNKQSQNTKKTAQDRIVFSETKNRNKFRRKNFSRIPANIFRRQILKLYLKLRAHRKRLRNMVGMAVFRSAGILDILESQLEFQVVAAQIPVQPRVKTLGVVVRSADVF